VRAVSLQNNYGILPQLQIGILTAIYPSVFHRELQKYYGILPQLLTGIPTFINSSVFHRVAKKIRHFTTITDEYTDGLAIITDVYADAFTNEWHTFQSAHLSAVTDGFADARGKTNACMFWRTISNRFADGLRKI